MMETAYIIAGSMFFGVILATILVRYGIGIGNKLTIQAQNDLPIDKKMPTILQSHTGENDE